MKDVKFDIGQTAKINIVTFYFIDDKQIPIIK